jgi:hypothetical protein
MFRARSAAAVIAVVAAIALGVLFGRSAPAGGRSSLAVAVASLPANQSVVGFTHWRTILERYSVSEANQRDLRSRSALADVDLVRLHAALGWGLRDLNWEVFSKDPVGDVVVVSLRGHETSVDRLRKSGYEFDGQVWRATGQIEDQQPLYRFVVPMPRRNLLVMSDGYTAVKHTRAAIEGRAPSFADKPEVAGIVRALAGVDTALIQSAGLGCQATAAGIDADSTRQVNAAQDRLGRLTRYRMLGRGLDDDGSSLQRFVVAMPFDSAGVASKQADIRGAMSTGPFIGRSGSMDEVLRLESARSDDVTATLTYRHPADSDYLMPGRGPLLPASC